MPETGAIIFFDGVCNLCNGFVQFVISRDKKGYFKFAALQSEAAKPYLKDCGISVKELGTVVLWENGECYTRSTAALRILRQLSGIWPVLYGAAIFPTFLRDAVYKFIAANRYKWFGRKDSCMLPTPELKQRFL